MSEIIITCPICRKRYKLMPKNMASLATKKFSCPNCQFSAPFSSLVSGIPSQPITHTEDTNKNVAASGNHLPTKVKDSSGVNAQAYLTVVGTNSKFILNQGVYVVGRRSSDSQATLQVAPDISMSRQHAKLAVQVVAGKLMAQIMGLKANNPIFVNGKMYAASRPCTLKSGDIIQMGTTKLVFTI